MKLVVAVVAAVAALIILMYFWLPQDQPAAVGGDRDEHGCLVAAGYAFNEHVGACVRAFEMTSDIQQAAALAVDSVGQSYALTVVSFNSYEEPGAYDIMLEQGLERTPQKVVIRKGVVETPVSTMTYHCDAGEVITATYYTGPATPVPAPGEPPIPTGMAEVTLGEYAPLTLYQTISADGVRYANDDESLVFWSKGDTVLVLEQGVEKHYQNCVVVPIE